MFQGEFIATANNSGYIAPASVADVPSPTEDDLLRMKQSPKRGLKNSTVFKHLPFQAIYFQYKQKSYREFLIVRNSGAVVQSAKSRSGSNMQ